jgi:SAM-dependent methyltransferase
MQMAQRESGLHSVLSLSWAYDGFQRIVGADQYRRRIVQEFLRAAPGQSVLDIGCGTAEILEHLPPVSYLGVDLSSAYIRAARARYGDRGEFLVGRADDVHLMTSRKFDLAVAVGLLHHLEDAEVERLFDVVRDLLSPGGKLIAVDCTWVEAQHPIAKFLIKRDRGLNVRTLQQTLVLAHRHFDSPLASIRSDLLRIPYTHLILECGN